ncbi:MAG: hypothetical protein ACLU4N_15810 [Butyricimonas faecihominis]
MEILIYRGYFWEGICILRAFVVCDEISISGERSLIFTTALPPVNGMDSFYP